MIRRFPNPPDSPALVALFALVLPLAACEEPADPWVCDDESWAAGTCEPGEASFLEATSQAHVDYPTELTYDAVPPSSGAHRPAWARWGEYEYLPPEHWLHNLEHGGAALLYHPCADSEDVDALREFARARAADDGGDFRWVLTPFGGLPSAVAVVTWEWTYSAECVDETDIEAFLASHYRQAPEDVASDGSFGDRFIGL